MERGWIGIGIFINMISLALNDQSPNLPVPILVSQSFILPTGLARIICKNRATHPSSHGELLNMKLSKSSSISLIGSVVFLCITFLPLFMHERILDAFVREDGIYENLTVVYLFITALLFTVGVFRFWRSSWLMRLSCAGLALLFFFGAGEEISWGDRFFDLDDKNFIRGVNVQNELSIHNLKYFQGEESILPISVSQLFTLFAFVFAVLIPLACRFSERIERFVTPRFPVMPLLFGVLLVLSYVLQKSMLRLLPAFPGLYQHPSMPIPQGVHEIREHAYTFSLQVSALYYFWREGALTWLWTVLKLRSPVKTPDRHADADQ